MFLLVVPPAAAVVVTGPQDTPVDLALPMPPPPGPGLGTTGVLPDDDEKPYFEKLPPDERVTGSIFDKYTLDGKQGKYAGWYGIIRDIKEEPPANQTTLTVQHVYSDGLTDSHIMTVSLYGAGDFTVKLKGTHLPLLPLRLVRVYGAVERYTEDKPVIPADFVKVWEWSSFNFMDYGTDKSNPQWIALNKMSDGRQIYNPYPKAQYYRERLGAAPAHLYGVMTQDQIWQYARRVPANHFGPHEMASPLRAPLFVGRKARVVAEHRGERMPFAPALSRVDEYVEFVQAGLARRPANIDREHIAKIEPDTEVVVVKYALPEERMAAVYQVRPVTGKYKGEEWWVPGFVLQPESAAEHRPK
jgi:hypothetical protein